jgi:hypothetical protein
VGTFRPEAVYQAQQLDERIPMRRYLIAAALVALLLPAVAAAKGPASATVSGPGLEGTLDIRGNGEGPGTALGTLTDSGGFFAQMFGQTPDPTSTTRPAGKLGLRYVVVYLVPGPNGGSSRVVQFVYPYAKPAPLTYMKPGQRFWGTERAHGGWFQASPAMKKLLVRAGLPARAPA